MLFVLKTTLPDDFFSQKLHFVTRESRLHFVLFKYFCEIARVFCRILVFSSPILALHVSEIFYKFHIAAIFMTSNFSVTASSQDQ